MIKSLNLSKPTLATGLILFSFLLPTKAIASQFTGVYSFGDSLSDTGNVFNASMMAIPPSPPYFNGRFSNGPIWLDYLSNRLGSPLTNFAFGGATAARDPMTGVDNTIAPQLPGLQEEIGLFINFLNQTQQIADPNALYTIWIGANDYLPTQSPVFTPFTTPTATINSTLNAVNTLLGLGARNIVVVNLPDLGDVPLTRGTPLSAPLNTLTDAHNRQLLTALDNLTLPPYARIIPLDVNTLVNNAQERPDRFGFTNITDPCLNQMTFMSCPKPEEYLFWDRIHPTTAAHQLIGELAFRQLRMSTPEPGLVLGIIAVGIVAIGGRLYQLTVNSNQ